MVMAILMADVWFSCQLQASPFVTFAAQHVHGWTTCLDLLYHGCC